jgi:eukaryotic-like serine/threonine-protein kinase
MDESQIKIQSHKTAKRVNGTFLPTVQLAEESLAETTLGGRYLIKQELGRGGFGAVYLALDQKMVSRPVVVKVLLDSNFADGWSSRKFHQEIEALARLDHPSIVGIFDAGETPEGRPYLVMQYVEGVSLRSAIKPEGMDFVRSANIIRQVGRALSAAHKKGIFHRDLKPENVMLRPMSDGDEQVKVIDFGVAKVRDSETLSSGMDRAVGTIAYMSPEQLSALPLTPASDIYSFGVMAYEMLTGRRPLNPESIYQLLEMQRLGVKVKPLDLRPRLPEAAQEVILKALSFEPNDRYQRVREFGDQLAWALIADDESTKPQSKIILGIQDQDSAEQALSQGDPQRSLTVSGQDLHGSHLLKRDQAHSKQTRDLGNRETAKTQPPASFLRKHFSVLRVSAIGLALLIAVGLFTLNWMSEQPLTKQRPDASGQPTVTTAASAQEQSFSYWLTVQKMAGRTPIGNPIQSSGDLMFGTGWKFRFNLRPAQPGVLYLLNVAPAKEGREEYNVLFPNPQDNGGEARLRAEETMQGGWYDFVGQTGVEKLWIIWSSQPLPDLDAIFSEAAKNKKDPGVIANSDQMAEVQAYLKKYYQAPPEVINDKSKKLTVVKGRGNLLVSLVELTHEAY